MPAGYPAPKKALGQNFLINPAICPRMVESAGINGDFGVLEIGPGLGALTTAIASRAARVVAVELDGELIPRLRENLAQYSNVEIVQGDAMKVDLAALIAQHFSGLRTAVMGNLPYNITSPLLMRLLESRLPVESITAMVQKEAAQRLCAPDGSRESGAVTRAVRYYSSPGMLFDVAPGSFFPPPKVTSSVIRLDVLNEPPVVVKDERLMFAIIKAAFSQRRKTAANAICSGTQFAKEEVLAALAAIGAPADIRPERLLLCQYAQLADALAAGRH